MEILAKRLQIEQNLLLRFIGKSWVGFRMAQLPTPLLSTNSPNHQNWGPLKLPLQITANGSRWSDTKIFSVFTLRLTAENVSSTLVALVPQIVGFSCRIKRHGVSPSPTLWWASETCLNWMFSTLVIKTFKKSWGQDRDQDFDWRSRDQLRSTQPFIPYRSMNWVPASARVMVGTLPLSNVR